MFLLSLSLAKERKKVQFVSAVNPVCLVSTICTDSVCPPFFCLPLSLSLLHTDVDYFSPTQRSSALSPQRKAHSATENSWDRQRTQTREPERERENMREREDWEKKRAQCRREKRWERESIESMREKKTVKAKVAGEERLGHGKRLERVWKQKNSARWKWGMLRKPIYNEDSLW